MKPYKQQIDEQKQFDDLVALRMEKGNVTKEDAIIWAKEFILHLENPLRRDDVLRRHDRPKSNDYHEIDRDREY